MRKEKINKLIESWKDDKEVLDIIQADVLALGEYTQAVYYMEFSVAIIKAKYEGEEVRDALGKNDQSRHDAHERAIMGVKRLNRFALMKGLEPIFEGDIDNRYEVADFCCATVKEYFDNRML